MGCKKFYKAVLSLAIVLILIFVNVTQAFAQSEISSKPKFTKLPLNFELTKKIEELKLKKSIKSSRTGEKSTGIVPMPFKITKSQSYFNIKKSSVFPERYDLRELNRMTSVKNQGSINDCWSFSALASLESNLKRVEGNDYDFSEIHMAVNHGFSLTADDGGNSQMATAYMSRWDGPGDERDEPYPNPAVIGNIPSLKKIIPQKHVQEVLFIPDRLGATDNDDIKWALINYGAIDASMLYQDEFYNETTKAYYNNLSTSINHGVNIIGWDDNYPKENFLAQPPGNGAFIVKNSWGESFGDGGYFYISYYDNSIGKENALFVNAESVKNYNKIYQYDELGMISLLSSSLKETWFSNVFTCSSTESDLEILSGVSFYTSKKNTNYDIYLETDFDKYGFTRVTSNKIKTGSIYMPGYHTIAIDNPDELLNGKKFAVVVKLYSTSEEVEVPIEYKAQGYSDGATAQMGQSFVSFEGSSWEDIENVLPGESSNVCLKAFTKLPFNEECKRDVNGDGVVNILDIAKLAKNYNLKISSTNNWDPYLDINNDLVVDIFDMVMVSKYIMN